ncbi:MAG: hypothetical protein NE327_07845 [Lentisphaeraceae bacterium]|nr:hypothetical protein [Lentisphaeraceae bacterium]
MKIFALSTALILSMATTFYFYSVSLDSNSNSILDENENLSARIVELEKENEALKAKNKTYELKQQQLKDKAASLEKLLKKVNEVKSETESNPVVKLEVQNEAPQMSEEEQKRREQLKKFLGKEIDKNYAAIFSDMGLSEGEIEQIKKRLLERDTEIVGAVFKSILQSLPTEEGQTQEQALAQSILDSIEKTNKELAVDMGDSFAEFQQMEQKSFTLRELSKFEGLLPENSLADEQKVRLNDLMFDHHNSVLQSVSAGETTFKQADEELVNKSSQFLDADQQKSLSNYLKMKRGGM